MQSAQASQTSQRVPSVLIEETNQCNTFARRLDCCLGQKVIEVQMQSIVNGTRLSSSAFSEVNELCARIEAKRSKRKARGSNPVINFLSVFSQPIIFSVSILCVSYLKGPWAQQRREQQMRYYR